MRQHACSPSHAEASSSAVIFLRRPRHGIVYVFATVVFFFSAGVCIMRHLIKLTNDSQTRRESRRNATYVTQGSSFSANEYTTETINRSTDTTTSAPVTVRNITAPSSSPSTSSPHPQVYNSPETKNELTSFDTPHASSPLPTATSTQSTTSQHTNLENVYLSRPRLALCIAGNSRTFHYPMVHNRILQNVVRPLQTVANVDIFFVIKLKDDPRPLHPRSPRDSSSTRVAMNKFRPVSIRELGPDDDILHDVHPARYKPVYKTELDTDNNTVHILTKRLLSKPLLPYCTADPTSRVYVPYALHRTRQCLTQIRSYEAKHRRVKYKYLYRIRPDVVFLDVIPMPMLLAPGIVMTNAVPAVNIHTLTKLWKKTKNKTPPDTGDHFLAALTGDANLAFSAVNGMHDCEFFKLPVFRNPEAMLLFWLLSKNLTPITPMAAWVLVRERSGPECKRLAMVRVTNNVEKDAMVRKCEQFKRDFHWSRTDSA